MDAPQRVRSWREDPCGKTLPALTPHDLAVTHSGGGFFAFLEKSMANTCQFHSGGKECGQIAFAKLAYECNYLHGDEKIVCQGHLNKVFHREVTCSSCRSRGQYHEYIHPRSIDYL